MKQFWIVLKCELNNYFKNKSFLNTTFIISNPKINITNKGFIKPVNHNTTVKNEDNIIPIPPASS